MTWIVYHCWPCPGIIYSSVHWFLKTWVRRDPWHTIWAQKCHLLPSPHISSFFFFIPLGIGGGTSSATKAKNFRQIKLRRYVGAESSLSHTVKVWCQELATPSSGPQLLGAPGNWLNHRTPHQVNQECKNSSWFRWISLSDFVSNREITWPEWIKSEFQMSSGIVVATWSSRSISYWMKGIPFNNWRSILPVPALQAAVKRKKKELSI